MSWTGVTHREKALCKSSSSPCLSELLFHQLSVGQAAYRSMTETVAETSVLEGAESICCLQTQKVELGWPHTWCDLVIPVSPWHWEAPAKRGCLSCSIHGKPDFPEAKANWWVLFVSPALPWVLAGVTTPCTGRGWYTDKAWMGHLQSVEVWHGAGHCVEVCSMGTCSLWVCSQPQLNGVWTLLNNTKVFDFAQSCSQSCDSPQRNA